MLNLPRLRLLSALKRHGTIARTAQMLSYTPSAVSQQLALLERETGVRLLERVGRGVRLTADAEALVVHVDAVLTRLEQAESDLAAAQPEIRGRLHVASFQSVVLAVLPAVLVVLAARHPELRVDVTQREAGPAFEELHTHDFDLILGEEYPHTPDPLHEGVDRSDLLADPLCVALPPRADGDPLPARLADLAETPWALDPADTPTGSWARSVCRAAGFEPRVQFDSPDPLLHAHLVRSGLAAAFVPALLAPEHLDGLVLLGLPDEPHRVLYTAVRTGRSQHPAVAAFRTALADAIAPRQQTPPWQGVLAG